LEARGGYIYPEGGLFCTKITGDLVILLKNRRTREKLRKDDTKGKGGEGGGEGTYGECPILKEKSGVIR